MHFTPMNYAPERQQGESRAKYAERRLKNRRAVQKMTLTGDWAPGHKTSRELLRDGWRSNDNMAKRAGAFSRGLHNAIAKRQRKQMTFARNRAMGGL